MHRACSARGGYQSVGANNMTVDDAGEHRRRKDRRHERQHAQRGMLRTCVGSQRYFDSGDLHSPSPVSWSNSKGTV